MGKPKAGSVVAPPIADLEPLEKLEVMLQEFVGSITTLLEADSPEKQIEAKTLAIENFKDTLRTQSAEVIDRIIVLIKKWEMREAEYRVSVKTLEVFARGLQSKAKSAASTLELAMIEMGLTEVNGLLHRLKIYKSPDLLSILDESAIPDEFFDKSVDVNVIVESIRNVISLHPQPLKMGPCACGAIEWPECRDGDIKLALLDCIPIQKTLNKERLLVALGNPDINVPGAILETGRKRIDIK